MSVLYSSSYFLGKISCLEDVVEKPYISLPCRLLTKRAWKARNGTVIIIWLERAIWKGKPCTRERSTSDRGFPRAKRTSQIYKLPFPSLPRDSKLKLKAFLSPFYPFSLSSLSFIFLASFVSWSFFPQVPTLLLPRSFSTSFHEKGGFPDGKRPSKALREVFQGQSCYSVFCHTPMFFSLNSFNVGTPWGLIHSL